MLYRRMICSAGNDFNLAIDEIEKVRTRNNVNWMDILRLAIKNDPDEAIKLLSKVNKEDKSISKLFSKLSD